MVKSWDGPLLSSDHTGSGSSDLSGMNSSILGNYGCSEHVTFLFIYHSLHGLYI